MGYLAHEMAVDAMNDCIVRFTKPSGAFRDRIQHWLYFRRRTGDDTQNFTRRRLLFQRLGEISIPFLQLLKQPHVLDGDDCLIGEGLEKTDLLVRERLDYHATNDDHADRLALAHQRRSEHGSDAKAALRWRR